MTTGLRSRGISGPGKIQVPRGMRWQTGSRQGTWMGCRWWWKASARCWGRDSRSVRWSPGSCQRFGWGTLRRRGSLQTIGLRDPFRSRKAKRSHGSLFTSGRRSSKLSISAIIYWFQFSAGFDENASVRPSNTQTFMSMHYVSQMKIVSQMSHNISSSCYPYMWRPQHYQALQRVGSTTHPKKSNFYPAHALTPTWKMHYMQPSRPIVPSLGANCVVSTIIFT